MARFHNPDTVAAPIAAYTHGVEVAPNARWLVVSGQIGNDADGEIADGIEAQSSLTWRNITEVLKAAGMGIEDIVKVTTYLVNPADLAAYGAARSAALGEHRPASTLVYVSGLAMPELLA